MCPYGLSWVDTPNGDLNYDGALSGSVSYDVELGGVTTTFRLWEQHPYGLYSARDSSYGISSGEVALNSESAGVAADEGHFFAECSNRGTCDTATGTCSCFPGYEGIDCGRSVCPNGCSGHGKCRYSSEQLSSYSLWDANKRQQCSCDPGWSGTDCSQRLCIKGQDPLEQGGDSFEVQSITLNCTSGGSLGGAWRITFTDVFGEALPTSPIDAADYDTYDSESDRAAVVSNALTNLPNDVVESVTVTTTDASPGVNFAVTFTANPGDVETMALNTDSVTCSAGELSASVSTTTTGNANIYECSDRGLCDYSTGLCNCFRGYTGDDCSTQNALAGTQDEGRGG